MSLIIPPWDNCPGYVPNEERATPNPDWKPVAEGEDVGGGFRVEGGVAKWFRLVCRNGKQVEESWEGPAL